MTEVLREKKKKKTIVDWIDSVGFNSTLIDCRLSAYIHLTFTEKEGQESLRKENPSLVR